MMMLHYESLARQWEERGRRSLNWIEFVETLLEQVRIRDEWMSGRTPFSRSSLAALAAPSADASTRPDGEEMRWSPPAAEAGRGGRDASPAAMEEETGASIIRETFFIRVAEPDFEREQAFLPFRQQDAIEQFVALARRVYNADCTLEYAAYQHRIVGQEDAPQVGTSGHRMHLYTWRGEVAGEAAHLVDLMYKSGKVE